MTEPMDPIAVLPAETPVFDEAAAARDALVRKAKRKLAVFLAASLLVVLIVFFQQGQRLFIFNFTQANLNATPASTFFSYVTYAFLLFTAGYAVWFAFVLGKQRRLPATTAAAVFPAFRKQYELFDLLGVIPAFLAVVVLVNAFFLSPAVVDGPSMEPTFYENDAVIVWHGPGIVYGNGEVVIIDRGDKLLIKRIVALPGMHLTVSTAGVVIDGDLVEPYVADYHYPYDAVIPEGYVFVLGDNRMQSNDSRYFGLVPVSDLLGRVVVKIDLF